MKITNIESFLLSMPLVLDGPTPTSAGQPRTTADQVLVRVDTDAGITGWGEAFGIRSPHATKAMLDTVVAPLALGRDATAISALHGDLQRALNSSGRNGPAMHALSGLDIALWDIAGKAAGLPLYRLLGGSRRESLPAYASLLRYGQPDAVARYTMQALGRGYRHIKVHEVTLPAVMAARETAGNDIPLMVDTNCPWTVTEAIEMAHQLSPQALTWLEEPVWPPEDLSGLAQVRQRGGIPIAAGENYGTIWEFRRAFEAGALDYAQPSVTKIGGVTEMRKVMALAESFGVPVAPHSPYFGPGLLATIHCTAALPYESMVERYYCDFAENPLGDAIHPRDGFIGVPQAPGLGLDPDPAVVARLRVA